MLAVTKHSNKWLAEMLGKDQATISKWCTNTCQPDLETLIRISDLLNSLFAGVNGNLVNFKDSYSTPIGEEGEEL